MPSDPTASNDRQLSEVNRLDPAAAEDPVSDADDIAGAPTAESGAVEEGNEVGPDARVRNEHHRRGRQ